MSKRVYSLCILLLACVTIFAQQTKNVTGVVKDAATGETLIGVSIIEQGTTNGTITDVDGKFAITIEGNSISASYVGYTTQNLTVTDSKALNILMSSDTELDEVVVVGYTSQKKSSITGAVAPVNMDDVNKRHVGNVYQSLQGQVAGVNITQSTGAPGDDISMLIRGQGSIGDNTPLYIIDGIPSSSITFLNPSDISSFTVLKDAAAASVYGSRAAGGVVVITTKSGSTGKGKLELNYYYGLQKVANLPKMLNSTQYMDVVETSWNNAGYSGTNPYIAEKQRGDLANTNWLDELFTTGETHNVQASISGATDNVNYLLSMGYIRQDGIVVYDNDKYQRFSLRSNISAKPIERLTIGTNVQLTYAIQDKLNSKGDAPGIIRHAMLRPPVLGVYKDVNDPTYKISDPFTDLPFYTSNDKNGGWASDRYEWTSNPIALAKYTDDKRTKYSTFGNVFAEYDFLNDKSLKFRTNLGIDLNLFHNKTFNRNFGDDDGGGKDVDQGMGRQNRPTSLNEERGQSFTLTWNNTLAYNKTFDKHSINAVGGSEFITNYDSSIGASRERFDYTTSALRYLDYGQSQLGLWNSGSASEWALMSYFISGTYVYDSRYMVTVNARADASSRFGSDNLWGYFPSFSVGWKLSEEKFLRDTSWLSDLKLRGSWGQLGNQQIENYAYRAISKKEEEGYGYKDVRFANPSLKWETTEQINVGVDFGALQNKIYVSADYFVKTTSDILLPVSLPSVVGGDLMPTLFNAATVRNKGFELAVTYRDNIQDFYYSVNANMATLSNKVTKLHPNLPNIDGPVTRTAVGQPLNSYYGFVMEGIYQNENEIKEHLYGMDDPTKSVRPGDIKFKDLNDNGKIEDNDRDFLGSPIPKFTYGFTLNGEYKGFSLSMFFQGVEGVKRYNDLKKILNYDTRPFNKTTDVLNAWHGEGTSNTIPRNSFSDNGGSKISSIFVEDASYFRLKNIELGYSFASQLKKANSTLSDIRVFASAENVFTVTKYSGLDPESTDLIDFGTYPQARTFLFGVNVKF